MGGLLKRTAVGGANVTAAIARVTPVMAAEVTVAGPVDPTPLPGSLHERALGALAAMGAEMGAEATTATTIHPQSILSELLRGAHRRHPPRPRHRSGRALTSSDP
jgi:hypothetical protein